MTDEQRREAEALAGTLRAYAKVEGIRPPAPLEIHQYSAALLVELLDAKRAAGFAAAKEAAEKIAKDEAARYGKQGRSAAEMAAESIEERIRALQDGHGEGA